MANPGTYSISVKSDIAFAPKQRKIQVIDRPLSEIKFVQKKVALKVSAQKMPECNWEDIRLTLSTADENIGILKRRDMTETGDDTLSGTFTDLPPGDYKLKVSPPRLASP